MGTFYITTAIDYANSAPHLGTAFEKIGADVIARYRRLCGDEVFFLMGNDEHSQNVRRKAQELNLDPKKYCDEMAVKFQETWKTLNVSYDSFIQTTADVHKNVVREIADRIFKARDTQGKPAIFKGAYEGFYCVSCEAFYQEKDLENELCPNHKVKPEWIREENYFFRLSAYSDRLKKLYSEHPEFLRPKTRRNEIVQLLEKGLEDISISRPNRDWGVRLPFDEDAVAYVWFDALINYVSGVGPIDGPEYKKFWPADLHVIGKDITRFHCLIWPAMLMAAKLPVPRSVWAHGFVSMKGEKMSKSRGNVSDPTELAQTYGADPLRYHLMREVPWGRDGDFTEERLRNRYNADLANDLGNLASRTLTMVGKYIGETLSRPNISELKTEIERIEAIVEAYHGHMKEYAIDQAATEAWKLVSEANLLIDQKQPWAMAKDPKNKPALEELFYVLLERLRWAALVLSPLMPMRMAELLDLIGSRTPFPPILSKVPLPGKQESFEIKKPSPLFPRLTD